MPTDQKEKFSFDSHVGKKLRNKRVQLKKTQTDVANSTNKTFQQVQKYEKGVNGMSGFVLGQVARYLKVPVTYFYEGYDYETFTSQLTYKDNEPEIHVNNQHRNEKHYPNPNSYGEITDHLNLQVVAAQKLVSK
ncbi:putative helix-turn-helix motif protein [uncultured Mediterranean phage uvDeep-CGR2-AD10-C281]|jgi:transcriptional regulator with XRE-family HTH domain|nr:putative helix-turn-helix motif protein [uncultured Mediterranean phage uvDeep-CGR2-AD10-C281]